MSTSFAQTKTTGQPELYAPQPTLKPQGLVGISNTQINDHWNLYVGYVNNVNQIAKDIASLSQNNTNPLALQDRRRRYGFEFNGMILHEYYFGNLAANIAPLNAKNELYQALTKTWGSYDAWQKDFVNTGASRGIGWAVLYIDPITKQLTNHFIADHENGVIAGFSPILVMDCWEHAYIGDFKADKRSDYITAFMKNINWPVVSNRYQQAQQGLASKRYDIQPQPNTK